MVRALSSTFAIVVLLATPGMGEDPRVVDEKRLPKQQGDARIWSLSTDPLLAMSITAGAEQCDAFLGEARLTGGNSGEVRATVCFGPKRPTGDVELVFGFGESLSMHYLSFTFDPCTRRAGYSLKRVLGSGSFGNAVFSSDVATPR